MPKPPCGQTLYGQCHPCLDEAQPSRYDNSAHIRPNVCRPAFSHLRPETEALETAGNKNVEVKTLTVREQLTLHSERTDKSTAIRNSPFQEQSWTYELPQDNKREGLLYHDKKGHLEWLEVGMGNLCDTCPDYQPADCDVMRFDSADHHWCPSTAVKEVKVGCGLEVEGGDDAQTITKTGTIRAKSVGTVNGDFCPARVILDEKGCIKTVTSCPVDECPRLTPNTYTRPSITVGSNGCISSITQLPAPPTGPSFCPAASGTSISTCDFLGFNGQQWCPKKAVTRVTAGKGLEATALNCNGTVNQGAGNNIDIRGTISLKPLKTARDKVFCPAKVEVDEDGCIVDVMTCDIDIPPAFPVCDDREPEDCDVLRYVSADEQWCPSTAVHKVCVQEGGALQIDGSTEDLCITKEGTLDLECLHESDCNRVPCGHTVVYDKYGRVKSTEACPPPMVPGDGNCWLKTCIEDFACPAPCPGESMDEDCTCSPAGLCPEFEDFAVTVSTHHDDPVYPHLFNSSTEWDDRYKKTGAYALMTPAVLSDECSGDCHFRVPNDEELGNLLIAADRLAVVECGDEYGCPVPACEAKMCFNFACPVQLHKAIVITASGSVTVTTYDIKGEQIEQLTAEYCGSNSRLDFVFQSSCNVAKLCIEGTSEFGVARLVYTKLIECECCCYTVSRDTRDSSISSRFLHMRGDGVIRNVSATVESNGYYPSSASPQHPTRVVLKRHPVADLPCRRNVAYHLGAGESVGVCNLEIPAILEDSQPDPGTPDEAGLRAVFGPKVHQPVAAGDVLDVSTLLAGENVLDPFGEVRPAKNLTVQLEVCYFKKPHLRAAQCPEKPALRRVDAMSLEDCSDS